MAIRVGMVSLGCPKNQVDAEKMMFSLRKYGFELIQDAALADVAIINTCGFIQSAKEEAIETMLEFIALKKEGRIKGVICTGCLAERYKQDILDEMPELDAVVSLGKDAEIAQIVKDIMSGENGEKLYAGDKCSLPLEGGRIISTQPFYAYLKIAEGCSNGCTYCAIPAIRGKFRSRTIENILEEARWLADNGVTELVVVAQDTTRYGEDIYGESRLPELIDAVCEIEGVHWVRILYCYPDRVTDKLIDTIARQPKAVHYFDIPVQHASAHVLRDMNRRGDRRSITALCQKIREKIPDVVLRTTLIAGFPTESEEDFAELCQLVEEVRFDRLGCFAYSQEEDTPAAELEQIPEEVRRRRAEIIMELQMSAAFDFADRCTGRTLEVLAEGWEDGQYYGRSYMDAPDIDTRVYFTSEDEIEPGSYVPVLITDTDGYDLIGMAKAKEDTK